MRAVKELRPPGVYPAHDELRNRPITVADTRIAGFVGVAAKGPLDEPRLLNGWNDFIEVYGYAADSYLSRAVEGFFLNGGTSCYVVRIAHRLKRDEQAGPEHPSLANHVVKDGWDKPAFRMRALNEGKWGNNVWVRFAQSTGARTLLTLDLDVGVGEARVNSVRGFERGALVRVYDRENEDYVVITEVNNEERLIRWASSTPIARSYRAAGPTYLEVHELEVYASLKDRREVFRNLQISPLGRRYAPRVVNAESSLIQLEDLFSKSPLPHCLPQTGAAVRLAGGRDGIEVLTPDDFIGRDGGPGERSGLMSLAGVDSVSMLAIPDLMLSYRRHPGPQADLEVQTVQDAMITLCERLKDRFAILDAPPTRDIEEVRKWRRRIESSFAALYYPFVSLESGAEGAPVLVPPSGHIAGVFARCDDREGVFKAPANEEIVGANGLAMSLMEEHLGLLNSEGINTIRGLPGRGVRIWGARTVTDDPDWRYVNVRRLFIMLRRSLEDGTQWAVFEPHEPRTWERLSGAVSEFLKELWGRGYFAGTGPEDSFFVNCNGQTNTKEDIETGRLVVEVGVAPSMPAEYIIFSVVQQMGDEGAAGTVGAN